MEQSSLREFDEPLSLEERRTCKTPPEMQGASCALGRTSMTKREHRAVLTEQGASASQMAAAKFSPSQSFLVWMEKQITQCSVHSSQNDQSFPDCFECREEDCLEIWIRIPPRQRPKGWDNMEDPVVPLERNLYGHPWAGLLWERNLEEVSSEKKHGRTYQLWNVFAGTISSDYSYRCMWLLYEWLERSKAWTLRGQLTVHKEIDFEAPTPQKDQVYLRCTQREATVDRQAVQSKKPSCSSDQRPQGRLTNKTQRKKHIHWIIPVLGEMLWKFMPKMR